MLNVDKNNKIIRTNHKNIENHINHFINTWKKTKINQTKTFTVIIVQENHSLITIIPLDNNYQKITIAEVLQIKETHDISHKIDIVDQTVKTINIEIVIQDETQTEVTTQITLGIAYSQSPEIDNIQTTVLEIPQITETETTQTIGIDNTQIKNHETIQTIYQIVTIITIDHVTIPGTEILTIQFDKEIIFSHRIKMIHNIKIHNKTIEVAHLNIKDKLTRCNQLKNFIQTLLLLTTHKTQNYN